MTGVYVHIPFCRSKCAYCDFHSGPRLELADAYLDALAAEASERAGETSPVTLYVGGGTPSALSLPQLHRLFEAVPHPEDGGECTIEVNPDDVTDEFAAFLASSTPVNRVSMGVQSMVESELRTAGRRHTPQRAADACSTLRRHGFDNLSLDLIYGLPGQTAASWRYSLDALLALGPAHLSAYMLSYEPHTRLTAMRDSGKITETSDDDVIEMYHTLVEYTRAAGMEHYEISNFAMPGMRAVHNSAYWNGADYIGLGTGAHSHVNGVRGYNPPDIKAYLAAGGRNFFVEEPETDENRFNDMLVTRLRTSDGLSLADLAQDHVPQLLEAAERHIAAGRVTVSDSGVMRITEEAWLVSDNILLDLIV